MKEEKKQSKTHNLALVFDSGAKNFDQLYTEFQTVLKDATLVFEERKEASIIDPEERVFLTITATRAQMEREAERIGLLKMAMLPETKKYKPRVFEVEDRSYFKDINADDFFSYAEKEQIVLSLLKSLTVNDGICKVLGCLNDEQLLACYQGNNILLKVLALHDKERKIALFKLCMNSIFTDPVHKLRAYYGEEVALYFGWMQFFTMWLIPPAIVGLALWYIRPHGTTIDDSPYIPFYGLLVVLWAHLFRRYWQRKCAYYAGDWGTLHHEGEHELTDVRAEFKGEMRVSPITGEKERYYPSWRRYQEYALSVLVTSCLLVVVLGIMICSFNLQGYMSDTESKFHVPILHQFSDPGAIFDPNGNAIMALVPVVFHSIMIMQVNNIYRHIAEWLTDRENHKTQHGHENALILKRFLFEAFDCYLPLFYLAFYELDAVLLRLELVALFTTDSFRRVFTESVIPWLMGLFFGSSSDRALKDSAKKRLKETPSLLSLQLIKAANQEEYEQFDDYLEMTIEFGYVTLFASSFPLASLLSIVCNVIEVRSDAFKLAFVTAKPLSARVADMGTWFTVLTVQSWLCVVTNCFIFGFSSDQMAVWFPWMFEKAVHDPNEELVYEAGNLHHESDEEFKAGFGRYAVGIVFLLEHILIVLALICEFFIPQVPGRVKAEIMRRDYVKLKEKRQERRVARVERQKTENNQRNSTSNKTNNNENKKKNTKGLKEKKSNGMRQRKNK